MGKIWVFIKGRKKTAIAGLVVILLVVILLLRGGQRTAESFTVKRTNVIQSVILSGDVVTSDRADLGFSASGRVGRIFVKNNEIVSPGTILAQLEIGDLIAERKIKELNLKTTGVDLEGAEENLKKVQSLEDTKVANAYRTLLSQDLALVPWPNTYDLTTPLVSGAYTGAEGEYRIRIYEKSINDTRLTLRTFGLEEGELRIDNNGIIPLGTKGLFIEFPDDVDSYKDTDWRLVIPNPRGASYSANLSAYQAAKDARDLAVAAAERAYAKIRAGESSSEASIALAEIEKINAEIKKNTITAPFAGQVTNIDKEVGESVSAGDKVISMVSEKHLEVILEVPELDVAEIAPGAEVVLALDAFPGEVFSGKISSINAKETKVEGVPVYEAFVELAADPRIRSGMSAKGTIVLALRENVLAVPAYFIDRTSGAPTVSVLAEGSKIEKRTITLGLTGTDNMTEVLSGLTEGERIVPVTNK